MKTIIERDPLGEVRLVVEAEAAPEAVVREYIKARDLLFPEHEEPEAKQIEKEEK